MDTTYNVPGASDHADDADLIQYLAQMELCERYREASEDYFGSL